MPDDKYMAVAATGGNTFIPSTESPEKPKEEYTADGEWVVVDNVPIFSEESGYNPEELQHICDNNNARVVDTGDMSPLIIGHTADDSPEEANEVVGYAYNFRLGTIGRLNPRKAIIATFKYFKDKWKKAKDFTRRSVELWPEPEMFIDGIALLGGHTPHCNLGLTPRFQKQGKKIICTLEENDSVPATYSQENTQGGSVENTEQFVKEIYQKLCESQEFAFIRQLMQERASKAESDKDEEKEPEKNAKECDEDKKDDDKEKHRLVADQLQGQVERYRRQNEAIVTELEVMKRKFRRAEREKDLVRLEANEGVIFSLAEELEEVQDLSPEHYEKHLSKMRTRYQKLPNGLHLQVANTPAKEDTALSRDAMYKAVNMSLEKHIPFEKALDIMKGGNGQ